MSAAKSVLKSLNFASFKPPSSGSTVDPVLNRRVMITKRLEEQKALLANPDFTRTVRVYEKDANGKKQATEKQQRVLPWFASMPTGDIAFFVKLGWRPVEIESGKPAIVVRSYKELPKVIDTLVSAVAAGELDQALAKASDEIASKLKRKTNKKVA